MSEPVIRKPKSNYFKIVLFILSLLSSYLIYKYLNLNKVDKVLLFNSEKNSKWSNYIEKFKNQTLNHEECNPNGCDCFKKQIDLDLADWKDVKLNIKLLSNTKKFGIHYQIINNTLYRQKKCLFQPRCEGVEYFLLKALNQKKFKNMDLIINVHDWPQIYNNYKKVLFPVFSFSKDVDLFKDITYPAWAFHSGGPAIESHPTGIGKWNLQKNKIAKYSNQKFSSRKDVAFFRGSRTNEERDSIILISRENPNLIDAKYTKNQAWRSIKDSLGQKPVKEVSFEEHCDYKYLINLRGVAASFRYRHLFMCKSLVLNVKSRWIEFFYSALKPWYHYVPLEEEAKNILNVLKFLNKYPQIAEQIAENGYNFVSKYLTEESALCYWIELLERYQTMINYDLKPEKDYILIK